MRVAGVTGASDSGKTTLLVETIARLVARGTPVAAIKHTHHPLNDELRGDTARLHRAGAEPVMLASDGDAIVFASSGIFRVSFRTADELPLLLSPAEVVLVEGFSRLATWPRLEMAQGRLVTADDLLALVDRIERQ